MNTKVFPKLFKFTKNGSVQQWTIWVERLVDGTARYLTEYGLVGGKIQNTHMYVRAGKNIGKANETTPFEQACSEAESKWKAQLDKGYAEGAPKKLPKTQPMLAKKYKPDAKLTWPLYYQPKLDGVRCVAHKVADGDIRMLSRKGKVFEHLGHITDVLDKIMSVGDILDGELYRHGETFQKLISWIKRSQDNTKKVQYFVYDMISDKPYSKRFDKICKIIGHNGQGIVRTTYTDKVYSHSDVAKKLDEQLARGFEGIMLRKPSSKYSIGRRSSGLLKVKKFIDEEFEIVGAEENKGRHEGQCVFVCKTDEGAKFKVKPMGTDEQRREYWDNHKGYIGKALTVKFFEWTSSKPKVPRFPVGVEIRDYE